MVTIAGLWPRCGDHAATCRPFGLRHSQCDFALQSRVYQACRGAAGSWQWCTSQARCTAELRRSGAGGATTWPCRCAAAAPVRASTPQLPGAERSPPSGPPPRPGSCRVACPACGVRSPGCPPARPARTAHAAACAALRCAWRSTPAYATVAHPGQAQQYYQPEYAYVTAPTAQAPTAAQAYSSAVLHACHRLRWRAVPCPDAGGLSSCREALSVVTLQPALLKQHQRSF